MKQKVLSYPEYSNRRKKAGRNKFIESMNVMASRDEETAFINPYSYSGGCGGSPSEIEKMLSMYLLQIWSNL